MQNNKYAYLVESSEGIDTNFCQEIHDLRERHRKWAETLQQKTQVSCLCEICVGGRGRDYREAAPSVGCRNNSSLFRLWYSRIYRWRMIIRNYCCACSIKMMISITFSKRSIKKQQGGWRDTQQLLIESRPYRVLELETKLSDLSGQVYQQEELQNKVKRLNEELLFWYVLSWRVAYILIPRKGDKRKETLRPILLKWKA